MGQSKRGAIREVMELTLLDLTTDQPVVYFDDLKTSGLTNEAETVYTMGGAGNPQIIGFDHSRRAMMEVSTNSFQTPMLGTLGGGGVTVGATPVWKRDELTVSSDAATTTHTALGDAGSEIKYLYILNDDQTFGTEFVQAGTVGAGEFTYTSGTKAITFNAAEVPDGTRIVCYYTYTSDALAQSIDFNVDSFAGNYKAVLKGLYRDQCTGVDYEMEVSGKVKVENTWALELSADGDPAELGFTMEFLKGCTGKGLFEIIIYDESAV